MTDSSAASNVINLLPHLGDVSLVELALLRLIPAPADEKHRLPNARIVVALYAALIRLQYPEETLVVARHSARCRAGPGHQCHH